MGYLDGTTEEPSKIVEVVKDNKKQAVPNTEHDAWLAKDQQLLGYLLNSLHKDVLVQVVEVTTSAELWSALQRMFSARSLAQVTNLRVQLANLKKGNMSTPDYFAKMKAIKDELAAAGKGVCDEELVSYIVNGLGYDYNPFVSSVLGRSEPTSLSDLFAQLMAYDTRLEMFQEDGQYQSSANAATRGRGGYRGCGNNNNRGRGCSGRGNGGRGNNNSNAGAPKQGGGQSSSKPLCQICKKPNHEAPECWYRYDEDYQPKSARAATSGYGVDTNWYTDSGSTDHITSELEKITVHDKYNGQDQIHTANGSGPGNQENSSSR